MGQLSRFSLVGLAATTLHVGVAYLAVSVHGFDTLTANGWGFLAAVAVSYYGHHRWTFALVGRHRVHLVRFVTVTLAAFALSHIVTHTVTVIALLPQVVALLFVALSVPVLTFVLSQRWALASNVPKQLDDRSWRYLRAAALVAIGVWIHTTLYESDFNHDTSWYFVSTRMWMGGQELYKGVMEINPPLFFYMIRFALGWADWFGVKDETGMRLVLFAFVAISLYLSGKVLRSTDFRIDQRVFLLLASAIALLIIPLAHFGQREHVFLISILPYIFAQAVRVAGFPLLRNLRYFAVLFSLPGLLLKPYFLIVPLFIVLTELLMTRRLTRLLSIENLVLMVGILGYLIFIAQLHPAYYQLVVPMGRLVYFAYGNASLDLLRSSLIFVGPPALFLLMQRYLPFSTVPSVRFSWVLAMAAVGAFCSFALQAKGWEYQLVPYWGMAWLFTVSLWVVSLQGRWRWLGGVPVLLALYFLIFPAIASGGYHSITTGELQRGLLNQQGRSIVVYSTNVSRAFPLVNRMGLRWTSRYPAQWLVPGAVLGLEKAKLEHSSREAIYSDLLLYARKTTVDDFLYHQPDIVIVDVRRFQSYFGGRSFDWIDFLAVDSRFAEGWGNYQLTGRTTSSEIWQRKVGAGSSGG